jgi:large subunit ribosomal protein L6
MSRIGEKPVAIPSGVTVSIDGTRVCVKGPKGELGCELPVGITARVDGDSVLVSRADDSLKPLHGLGRSLVANMVEGVDKGYRKDLEIQGVGFRAGVQGQALSLALGFASPVEYRVPEGVTVAVNNNTEMSVSGCDKQQVGEAAARIRAFYPAEPYKGKGIRYKGEHVRRKVGKTVA